MKQWAVTLTHKTLGHSFEVLVQAEARFRAKVVAINAALHDPNTHEEYDIHAEERA